MSAPTRDDVLGPPNWTSTDALGDNFLRELPRAAPPPLPGPSSSVAVTHIPQTKRWDCGLACVAMALSLASPPPSLDELKRLAGTTSVWSIDLAHLLARCGAPAPVLFTVFPGVRPDYESEAFYAPHIAADTARVTALFAGAAGAGVGVAAATLDAARLRWAVGTGRFLVIALLDKTILNATGPIEAVPKAPYTGHYIVLRGYDAAADEYLIRDPAAPWVERLSATRFEAARTAHGTDEDLVFVAVPGGGGGGNGNADGTSSADS